MTPEALTGLAQGDVNSTALGLLYVLLALLGWFSRDAYRRLQKDVSDQREQANVAYSKLFTSVDGLRERLVNFEARYIEAHGRDIGAVAAANQAGIARLEGQINTMSELFKVLQEHDREHALNISKMSQWMAESKEAVRSIDLRLTNIERSLRFLRGGHVSEGEG